MLGAPRTDRRLYDPAIESNRPDETRRPTRVRRRTATSNFGAGGRESHDATAFYDRFRPPALSSDDRVAPALPVAEPFVCGDARAMDAVADASVALVVTSPPYFAGKQYEEELERDGVPSSYLEYLDMLTAVFADCVRGLEPGGRIAVNVANLGRKPYRSLSADVSRIFEDLGLLLRGEIVWRKAEGASGSVAWGSFRSAANPVLRDLTERVVVASKGRFDRARTTAQRAADGLPHRNSIGTDDFVMSTLDVWSIPPESARRVGHPAPFPVALPARLIELFTYVDDLVLDPFMGSGSALVAAASLGRRYVGYDLDPAYVAMAQARVAAAVTRRRGRTRSMPATAPAPGPRPSPPFAAAGFTVAGHKHRSPRTGVVVDLLVTDAAGEPWHVLVGGSDASVGGGLDRSDTVWRVIGRAAALRGRHPDVPVLVVTTRPVHAEAAAAVRAAGPTIVHDVVVTGSVADLARLAMYAGGLRTSAPPGFW